MLSFLKQQAATASMNTSLDITLALSRLILQLHTTFSIAPVEWIGANDGQVWSNQFLIVVKILLDKFLNLSTKPSNWKTSFVEPILILLQNLSKSRWGTGHTKLLSHIQVQNLLKCRAALVALDIEYSLSNNDIDHLFKEGLYSDSLSSIHAALIQVILCSPSADRDRIETFRWCFENVHKEQLDSSLILECVKEHIHIFTIDQNVALTVLNFLDSLIRTTVDVKLRALALYCFFQMKKCQPVKKRKRDYHSIDQKLEEYQQLSLQIYEEQASPSYKLLEFLTFLNNHF